MKAIRLSKGKLAIVDDEDFEWLNKWKWSYLSNGYAFRNIWENGIGHKHRNHMQVLMHRLIMRPDNNHDIDHINGDGLDNRKENLRVCTVSQNLAWKEMQSNNTSGYRGVYWHETTGKWRAILSVNRIKHSLGLYAKKSDAALAYDSAKVKYFGKFARTNL